MSIVSQLLLVHFERYINTYFFWINFLCSISLYVGCKCHLSVEYYHVFEGCSVHGLCFVHKLCVWQWNFYDRLWNHQINFICNACLPASSSFLSLFILIWTHCYVEVSSCKIEIYFPLHHMHLEKQNLKCFCLILPYSVI